MELAVGSGPWLTTCRDWVPGTVPGGRQTAPHTHWQPFGAADKYKMPAQPSPDPRKVKEGIPEEVAHQLK